MSTRYRVWAITGGGARGVTIVDAENAAEARRKALVGFAEMIEVGDTWTIKVEKVSDHPIGIAPFKE